MVEVVVEDLVAPLCVLHGEIVAGADKEKVPHHVANHPLVQEPVIYVLPVCVLQQQEHVTPMLIEDFFSFFFTSA